MKTSYNFKAAPQQVDFTRRMTLPALGTEVLNVADVDASGKGFGIDRLMQDNCSWVLSRFAIEIDERPLQHTEYRIDTWVNEYTRLMSTRNFTLHDTFGHEFGRAVSQWCIIDLAARKAIDLSELGHKHADTIFDCPSPTEKPRRVPRAEPQKRDEHRVLYSDIDFNSHMNTMRYIDLMFDMLPLEMLREPRPMRLDIHFLQECRYGQSLTTGYEQRGEHSLFEISNGNTVAVRASIEWKK
jgi:acyl-ACP thioesterase